jgi:ADP-ribosyl-[dinitrogen reductase] hydrolase
MTDYMRDRHLGIMLGLACGDALGAQVEFRQRGTFPLQRDFTGRGPHNLEPGQWTDDTAMALILAEYLRQDPKVQRPNALAGYWGRWYREGEGSCTGHCFDIGNQTREALVGWHTHGRAPNPDTKRRGNGALMRVAPCVFIPKQSSVVAMSAHRQALVTHGRDSARLCVTFVELLADMLTCPAPAECRAFLRFRYEAVVKRHEREVDSSGYDVATFEAAIWCVANSVSIEEAIITAANLGDDADTVAAVTGALAGAVWGASGLPSRWLDVLAWRDRLTEAVDNLREGL